MTIKDQYTSLTEHFDWSETIVTNHRNLSNIPANEDIWANIYKTALQMEVVRKHLLFPISINSWYRSPEVNKAVGGSKTSDHMTGCAVDFIAPKYGSPLLICKKLEALKRYIGFKQLILEHTWVHISWDHIPNAVPKLQVLSLLANKKYATGLTDKYGVPYK